MNEEQFKVMHGIHAHGKNKKIDNAQITRETGLEQASVNAIVDDLIAKRFVTDGALSDEGYVALSPYKVDNAIIMAAGRSSRCLPFSEQMPKGLFKIKGEILLERQIEQLKSAGINQIILVLGYQKEKFAYLKDKYGVLLIENDQYARRNNIHSLFVAQGFMGNSYICCSDNYFVSNVFRDYVYDSYYSAGYADIYMEEYCITQMNGDYIGGIKKGGAKSWYTLGEAYFNRTFSALFLKLLNDEYNDPSIHQLLMDDYLAQHIDVLKIRKKPDTANDIKEFDSIEECIAFDPAFKDFMAKFAYGEYFNSGKPKVGRWFTAYEQIKRYNVVPTEQKEGRLHVNENLFKPSPACMEVLKTITYEDIYEYDLVKDDELEVELSKHFGIPQENLFVHNGSAEILKTIMGIALNKDDAVLIPEPGWNYYKSIADVKLAKSYNYTMIAGEDSFRFDIDELLAKTKQYNPKVIVVTTPNNPTGNSISHEDLERVIILSPDALVLVDEAYVGLSDIEYNEKLLVTKYPNVVFSRTFSKIYGLANMRVGYCICSPYAKVMFGLDLPLFRSSIIGRRMAIAALRDTAYYTKLKEEITATRAWFTVELNKMPGVKAFRSHANFIFIDFAAGLDAQKIKDYLQAKGILVRLFGYNGHLAIRITMAPRTLMETALALFKESLRVEVP
ncbi:aminotransferase class I/II-fold pyridoxal phosphate-dependent enzyme [Breznakiellaceae bacterium SP9]